MAGISGQGAENDLTGLVKTLVSVIEEKDPFMKGHAERVATNCVIFSRQLGLTKIEINQIYLAGLLHDVGIVYIPPEITRKTGKLTDDEMDMVKKHPLISEKILSKHDMLKAILPIIRHHHESYDGSGYPDGLKAEEIPIGAMIINLVNYFDSMTSARLDRPSMSIEDALKEIDKKAGQQFDKELAKDFHAFIRAHENIPKKIGDNKKKEETPDNDKVENEEDKGTAN